MTQQHAEHPDRTVGHFERMLTDRVYFVKECFAAMGWDLHNPIGWVEEDLINWFTYGPTKSITLGWRGLGKTHIIACIAIGDLFVDPDSKVMIVSKSDTLGKKILHLIRAMIGKIPWLRYLMPNQKNWDQRDNAEAFDAGPSKESLNPSVCACGIDGGLPGTRGSRVIAEDVEQKSNTRTVKERKALEEGCEELVQVATYGEKRVNVIGTYHAVDSLYLRLHFNAGFDIRSYPVCFPDEDMEILGLSPAYRERLRDGRGKPGEPAANYRIDQEYVDEQFRKRGSSVFATQGMLIANYAKKNQFPLKLANLIVHPCGENPDQVPRSIMWGKHNSNDVSTEIQDIPCYGLGSDTLRRPARFDTNFIDYQGNVLWIDPAGKGKDRTAWCVVGYASRMIYIRHVCDSGGGSRPEVLDLIAKDAQRFRVKIIHVEDFGLQDAWARLLETVVRDHYIEAEPNENEPGWRCPVECTPTEGRTIGKEDRIIDILESPTENHRIVIDRSVAENEDFQRQYAQMSRVRGAMDEDGIIDAVANGVSLFTHKLGRTQKDEEEKRQKKEWLKTMERYGARKPRSGGFRHRAGADRWG